MSHRALFIQIMAKVENSVYLLNKMKDLVEFVPEESILDSYEDCLDIQHQMLEALVNTPHFGDDPEGIRSSFFFAEGLENRVKKTFLKFKESIDQSGLDLETGESQPKGCYFCSRPFLVEKFKTIKTKISGLKVSVSSCPWCIEEIKSTGSMKVLYFQSGEERIHWSKVDSYDPSKDFWLLYDDLFLKKRRLKVVFSNGEAFDSDSR